MKSDIIMKYIDDNIDITNNDKDTETIKDLYDNFKDWYRNNYTDKLPNKDLFVDYISKKMIVDKNKIKGIRISNDLE